jgi:hypothetical protein
LLTRNEALLIYLKKSLSAFDGTMVSTIVTAVSKEEDGITKSRACQMEMLEESLKGNVIVAICFLPSFTVAILANNT